MVTEEINTENRQDFYVLFSCIKYNIMVNVKFMFLYKLHQILLEPDSYMQKAISICYMKGFLLIMVVKVV